MTYKELYEKAEEKLEKGEITCGEFDKLTKPLDEEIRQHGECNKCRHYKGGCLFWGIGGVLLSDYCSRFEERR